LGSTLFYGFIYFQGAWGLFGIFLEVHNVLELGYNYEYARVA
jgi:hypothetical protein